MKRYGFLQEEEYDLIDKIIDLLKDKFGSVQFLEIGILGGVTAAGVVRRCNEVGIPITRAAGVDISPTTPSPLPIPEYEYYSGDSLEQWRNIKGNFNFLFIDGCHCGTHAMCDFLNYSPFLVVGGYCLFHDTAAPGLEKEQDYFHQDHSAIGKPDSVLGVRNGLKKIGLLQNYRADWKFIEEVPNPTGLMGMVLVEKLKEL